MSAVVSTVQRSGLGYDSSDVAKIEFYFLPIDSNIADSDDYPMDVPVAGTIYSYECWITFRCDVAPSQYCKDFKIWTDGSLGAGQKITINKTEVDDYLGATNTKSAAGTRDDITNYTSGNELSVVGELNNVGDMTSWMVFQLELSSNADSGHNTFQIYYEYTEV